jgi:dTMP kinase
MAGYFISIEGIEGAGKSTQLKFIQCLLEEAGKPVVVTREPGGTLLGERIRELLLAPEGSMATESELLLIFAARVEHVVQVIHPALAAGQWVLCDRFTDASYAYQGGGRGLARARIAALEAWALGGLHPNLTLLLDVPVALGLQRAAKRDTVRDRFEQEQASFFTRVRSAYLTLAKEHPSRYRIIDAAQALPEVQEDIRRVISTVVRVN